MAHRLGRWQQAAPEQAVAQSPAMAADTIKIAPLILSADFVQLGNEQGLHTSTEAALR